MWRREQSLTAFGISKPPGKGGENCFVVQDVPRGLTLLKKEGVFKKSKILEVS